MSSSRIPWLNRLIQKTEGMRFPKWLKIFIQQLNDLMVAVLKEAGQLYINYLKEQIILASQHSDWSDRQKFDYVFKQAKDGFFKFAVTLKDNEVGTLINYLVSLLKKQGAI
jgi:hypothetical protein